jgi:hypothetical protein
MIGSFRAAASTVALVVLIAVLSGCAASPPPPIPSPPPAAFPLDSLDRVVVVTAGESRFASAKTSSVSSSLDDSFRIFGEVMKWVPSSWGWAVPMAQLLRQGIGWLMEEGAQKAAPKEVSPAAVVASTFAQTVLTGGASRARIVVTDREPTADARKDVDAIVRIAVPAWGVMRVQDGTPPLMGAFADVRAEMLLRETGVVVWRHEEEITHPERVPEGALRSDPDAARARLAEVLERAGRRMGSELVYAMGRR